MFELSFEVIIRTMFAADLRAPLAEIAAAIEQMTSHIDRAMTSAITLPLAVPTASNRRFLRARAVIDDLTRQLIVREHDNEGASEDLLSFLMAARDADTGRGMTDAQTCDEVKSFLLAGHETVAKSLAWTFYSLGQAPELMQQVIAEARDVLGDRPATLDDCANLTIITRVIKESMRLHPPGWLIGRNTVADDVIGGRRVPARSMMFVVPWVTHRLAAHWPNPLTFDPDRFTPEQEALRPKYAYLPFGGGPHVCIGQSFAMLEMQLIVATIAQRFAVVTEPSQNVIPNPRITLGMKEGLRATLRRHPREGKGDGNGDGESGHGHGHESAPGAC